MIYLKDYQTENPNLKVEDIIHEYHKGVTEDGVIMVSFKTYGTTYPCVEAKNIRLDDEEKQDGHLVSIFADREKDPDLWEIEFFIKNDENFLVYFPVITQIQLSFSYVETIVSFVPMWKYKNIDDFNCFANLHCMDTDPFANRWEVPPISEIA